MMRPGVLTAQFVAEADAASGLVRWLSAGTVSHVDLEVPRDVLLAHGFTAQDFGMIPMPRKMLLGARFAGGVKLRAPNYAKFTVAIRKSVTVPDIDAAYGFAFAQLGKPYAKRKIVNFFLHKFGKDAKFDPNRKSWFCDELLFEIAMAGGVQLLDTRNPLNLTPECVMLSPWWTQAMPAA